MADEAGPPDASASEARSGTDRMREDWNRRATENAEFFIASGAADSDERFRASGRNELEGAVLDGVELRSSARALEIGCGVGRLLVPLSERVREAYGVDISDVMIEKSRAFCAGRPNITTSVTDGTLSAFADASLDFVFSFIVFQHVPDRAPIRAYLAEAARVLAPGGFLRFQVDGRWERKNREAGTYDGVKLSPESVHELVAPTGVEVLDEWGQETHYHWITAKKPGTSPHVRFLPREWNEKVLRGMLARCGVWRVGSACARVIRGELSLKRALAAAAQGLDAATDEVFVTTLYRRVWGVDPSRDVVASLVALLGARVEFREDVLDILLFSAELRDFVRPRALLETPWYRLERLREMGVLAAGDVSPDQALDVLTPILEAGPPEELVAEAFRLILGSRPDQSILELAMRLREVHKDVPRSLAHWLFVLKPPQSLPPPPPSARVEALLARVGCETGAPRPGESFPGEAAIARRVLADTDSFSVPDFISHSYRAVFGRDADAEGSSWYAEMLAAGNLNRVGLVHQLLWSDELRRA